MRNVECGIAREGRSPSDALLYIPHSALRIPHLRGKALLHHAANQMLDGEMNLLDPRRVVRGNDQHDVAQVFEPAARMPHEAHDRHPAGLRGLCGADHIGAFPARRVEGQHVARPGQRLEGGEPRPGLLRGRHPAAAWTSAGKSAADAPRSSSAVPTTTKSAPAARAARTWAALLIPPPTNSVRSGTAARQARITSAATGRGAPLPASR